MPEHITTAFIKKVMADLKSSGFEITGTYATDPSHVTKQTLEMRSKTMAQHGSEALFKKMRAVHVALLAYAGVEALKPESVAVESDQTVFKYSLTRAIPDQLENKLHVLVDTFDKMTPKQIAQFTALVNKMYDNLGNFKTPVVDHTQDPNFAWGKKSKEKSR